MMLVEQNVQFCIVVLVMKIYIYTARICSLLKLLLVRGEQFVAPKLFIPGIITLI